jgi:hypothetical protein
MEQIEHDVDALAESMVSEGKMSGQWSLSELFSIFDVLTKYDVKIEQKIALLTKFTRLAFGGAFIGFAGSLIVLNSFSHLLAFTITFLVICLIAGIVGTELKGKYGKLDLQNEFREYIRPLLENLQEDLKKDAPVSLDLCLALGDQEQFSKGQSERYHVGMYPECYDYFFERDFLTLKLRFSDGNRLMLSATEFLTKTKKERRKRKGNKIKFKFKKRMLFDVRLVVNSEKFLCKKMPTEGKQKFYAKQNNGTSIIGIKFAEKLKGETIELVSDPLLTLQHIVKLYTFLQAKKAE